MSMHKRMDDVHFHIGVPACLFCQNVLHHKYNNEKPEAPIMTCAVLGTIPSSIDDARSHKCGSFVLDAEQYSIYKGFFPKDFNPDTINK